MQMCCNFPTAWVFLNCKFSIAHKGIVFISFSHANECCQSIQAQIHVIVLHYSVTRLLNGGTTELNYLKLALTMAFHQHSISSSIIPLILRFLWQWNVLPVLIMLKLQRRFHTFSKEKRVYFIAPAVMKSLMLLLIIHCKRKVAQITVN